MPITAIPSSNHATSRLKNRSQIFLEVSGCKIDEMKRAFGINDFQKISALAQCLKTGASAYGFVDLGEIAFRVESLAHLQRKSELNRAIALLTVEISRQMELHSMKWQTR